MINDKRDKSKNDLRNFYENEYDRGSGLANAPEDGDFVYGLVLKQIRKIIQPGCRVLDLGCHTGSISLYLAKAGCNVTGIDLAQNAIDIANSSAAHLGVKNIKFLCMDFLNDWKDEDHFGVVICSHVLEHVPDDFGFLKKINEATQNTGSLLLLVPTIYSFPYRINMLLYGHFLFDQQVGHIRRYTKETIYRLLTNSGYKINKTVYLDSFLRESIFLFKGLNLMSRLFGRKYVRNIYNYSDSLFARIITPGTLCIHATKISN